MFTGVRRPSPAFVIALAALFFSMTGFGIAAGVVPLAKRSLIADNARHLQGKTAAQVVALARPTSMSAFATVRSTTWSIGPAATVDVTGACASGEKVVGGGFDRTSGDVLAVDTRPTTDGQGWRVTLANLSPTTAAAGNVYAACIR